MMRLRKQFEFASVVILFLSVIPTTCAPNEDLHEEGVGNKPQNDAENNVALSTTTVQLLRDNSKPRLRNSINASSSTNRSKRVNINNTSSKNCYTCKYACAYKMAQMLFIVSLGASVLVILRIWQDKRLHKATFVAIACLAMSDTIFLAIHFARALEIIIRSLTCTTAGNPVLNSSAVKVMIGISWFSSNGHITLMTIVRYILLVDPIRSMFYLTNKRVMLASLGIWILGALIFGTKHAVSSYFTKTSNILSSSILWILVYLMPLAVTIVLHFAKLLSLRRTLANQVSSKVSRGIVSRMTRMILLLVFLAAIFPLPRFVYVLWEELKFFPEVDQGKLHLRNIALLCFLITQPSIRLYTLSCHLCFAKVLEKEIFGNVGQLRPM